MTPYHAPDEHAPRTEGPAVAWLDLLRAAAAQWVVFAHLLLLFPNSGLQSPGGGVAVVVFFLLSGFLITQSLMKRRRAGGTRVPDFLADRVARIMTPYVPALLIIAAVDALLINAPHIGGAGLSQGIWAALGNLLMLQDYPLFQMLDPSGKALSWRIRPYHSAEPFWTVAIEMWIYVAIGVAFFAGIGERLRRGWVVGLLAVSLPVVVWNAAVGGGKSLTLIWLLGSVAGIAMPALARLPSIVLRRRIAQGITLFGALALAGHSRKFGFDPYELQTASLIGLLMFGPFAWLQTVPRMPGVLAGVAAGIASYSYSLYLIHNTAIVAVWTVVNGAATPATLAIAVISANIAALAMWWLFERHYRLVGRWLKPRFERAMAPRPDAGVALGATESEPAR